MIIHVARERAPDSEKLDKNREEFWLASKNQSFPNIGENEWGHRMEIRWDIRTGIRSWSWIMHNGKIRKKKKKKKTTK